MELVAPEMKSLFWIHNDTLERISNAFFHQLKNLLLQLLLLVENSIFISKSSEFRHKIQTPSLLRDTHRTIAPCIRDLSTHSEIQQESAPNLQLARSRKFPPKPQSLEQASNAVQIAR